MATYPTVSVIVPTYNRVASLQDTLASLARQTLPADQYEVIVVDDGSTDDTARIRQLSFPFELFYSWKTNAGDAAARNFGAALSKAELLLFLDDDMVVGPTYLEEVVRAHASSRQRLVVGTAHLWLDESTVPCTCSMPPPIAHAAPEPLPFVEVCSNNLSVRRDAYFTIGLMSNLGFGGSSIWCDVDFAFRAYQLGFECYRLPRALCWHRDYVARSLDRRAERMRAAAYRAAALFKRHPELPAHLPMFRDMLPIAWLEDSPLLILRKVARQLASTDAALDLLERLSARLPPSSDARRAIARWIVGAHIFQGYRQGMRDLAARTRSRVSPA